MLRKWLGAVCLLAFIACLLAPGVALADTAKANTHFLQLKSFYSTPHGETTTTVSGTLVYRKLVSKHGKTHKVDVALDGGVYLFRRNDSSGKWVKTAWERTSHGAFNFQVTGASYKVVYVGTKSMSGAHATFAVGENVLGAENFGGLTASHEASGDVFVTLSADLTAPAGVISTSTPGSVSLFVYDETKNQNWYWDEAQTVATTGTYKFGFTVPAAQEDHVFKANIYFRPRGFFPYYYYGPIGAVPTAMGYYYSYVLPTSAQATFTPSVLVP